MDSNDLPLNVSREILQQDQNVDSMRSALTRRCLDMLAKLAKNAPEDYATFWREFGQVLKEGPAEDYANREKIAGLLRFATTHKETEEQTESLDDYLSRVPEGQDRIYYVVAENFATARRSPHLEVFRKRGIEVLLLWDRVDDWLMSHLQEYEGKTLQDVARGELDLGEAAEEDEKEREKRAEESKDLLDRIARVLDGEVAEVRASARLTDSAACLVVGEHDMGAQMRRLMEAAGQPVPETNPILEINASHPLLVMLDQESDEDRFADLTRVVFDQATLAEGGQLKDPASYVDRLNRLLLQLSGS